MKIQNGSRHPFLVIIILVSSIAGYFNLTDWPRWLMSLSWGVATALGFWVLQWVLSRILPFVSKIKTSTWSSFLACIVLLYIVQSERYRLPDTLFYGVLATILVVGIIWEFTERNEKPIRKIILRLLAIALVTWIPLWFLWPGSSSEELESPAIYYKSESSNTLSEELKGYLEKGTQTFSSFTYGSGEDKNREEYRLVKYKTESVDGSAIIPVWTTKSQEKREDFLGFGPKNFPINARVWMPDGQGPFPLFVIVHGNHSMTDWSDGGYAYLGEHLASKGIITVSVDENFLNGFYTGDFRGKEMAARGWLLLKHLDQWKDWTTNPAHELHDKVDWGNIILAGHSRGGEAVQIAAVFNTLDRFPDNGNIAFDFNYSIKGIISIAPTDYRYDRQVSMENLNYLGIQGSYDSDENSFWGMRSFRRLQFTDSLSHFKAGVYVHKANHSQFNSDWGTTDAGPPGAWLLNQAAQLSPENQRKIAQFYITAFVESTIRKQLNPPSIFMDAQPYRSLLPDTYIALHFKSDQFKSLITFGEDNDLRKQDQLSIEANGFAFWTEKKQMSRGDESLQNHVLELGWSYDSLDSDYLIPTYTVSADRLIAADTVLGLYFIMGAGDQSLLKNYDETDRKWEELPYNFSMVLSDSTGEKIEISIQDMKKPIPRLFSEFAKLSEVSKRLGNAWELQTESFLLPIERITALNHVFQLQKLQEIQLRFNHNSYGVFNIDELGYY